MKYLHTMVRVTDLDESLDFYCNKFGLVEVNRKEVPAGRFTLVFLAAPGDESAQVELTYNWDPEEYDEGRNFGHLAYQVDNIYELCQTLMDAGVTINRPPHPLNQRMPWMETKPKKQLQHFYRDYASGQWPVRKPADWNDFQ